MAQPSASLHSDSGARTAILLDFDGDPCLLGVSLGTPIRLDGPGLLNDAAGLLAAAERSHRRELDRLRRCERFIVLADLLATAESRSDVFEALTEHVPAIVDAWQAAVFRRRLEVGEPPRPSSRSVPSISFRLDEVVLEANQGLALPTLGLLERDAAYDPEDPIDSEIGRAVFDRTPAHRAVYAAIGNDAILVVADRRTEREFGPGDLDLLRAVSRQAAAALARLT